MIFEGTKKSIFFGLGLTRAGVSMPTVDNLYALSELFKMPMDCIVCGSRQSAYFNYVDQYNEAQIRRISEYYKILRNNQVA